MNETICTGTFNVWPLIWTCSAIAGVSIALIILGSMIISRRERKNSA